MSKTKAPGAEEAIAEFRSLGGPFEFIKLGSGVNSIRMYSATIRLFNLFYPNARENLPIGERRFINKLNMKQKEDRQ